MAISRNLGSKFDLKRIKSPSCSSALEAFGLFARAQLIAMGSFSTFQRSLGEFAVLLFFPVHYSMAFDRELATFIYFLLKLFHLLSILQAWFINK